MTDEEDKARARRFIREEHMTRRQFEEEFPHQFANVYAPIFESEGLFFKGPEIGGKPSEGEGQQGDFVPSTPRQENIYRRAIRDILRSRNRTAGQRASSPRYSYVVDKRSRVLKISRKTHKFAKFSKAERREMSKR